MTYPPDISITPADVGERVVVRRALARGGYTDVVGMLEGWADGVLTVRRSSGELVQVEQARVVAAKRVPPPPGRRRRGGGGG